MEQRQIKRALISVTDKTGVCEFAQALVAEFGVEIISTGGTAATLAQAGISVTPVEEITQFPEMMGGRVKTLHPAVHGGLLAKRDNPEHLQEAEQAGIGLIDLVVVNLYDFESAVQEGGTLAECIEKIDIGGPSMLRSAAKNFASVTVVSSPKFYEDVLASMRKHQGCTDFELRARMAYEVFAKTSQYDLAIANWLMEKNRFKPQFPTRELLSLNKKNDLRYGENPHQKAAVYAIQGFAGEEHSLAHATQHQGKELSYNNYLDLDAAWTAVREFEEPACVIVKHLTPCGVAEQETLELAYMRAHACDPISAFGGVIAFNRPVTESVIEEIFATKQFVEALVAPEIEPAALKLLEQKPNLRALSTHGLNRAATQREYRSVEGGLLVQYADQVVEGSEEIEVVSERKPSPEELKELLFAWRACKSVKSNAIVISAGHATVGVGGGQPNRVNAARIAVSQAKEAAQGACAASDAFFPFADGLQVLADAGVRAIIEPGGSVRDNEVIAAANEAKIALVFIGKRHFRH